MRSSANIVGSFLLILAVGTAGAGEGEGDVIRLGPARAREGPERSGPTGETAVRRGFDYAAFEARLESLWFQRKTLLASGRVEDSRAQLEQIRAFCAEEGIRRIEDLAGALESSVATIRRDLAALRAEGRTATTRGWRGG